MRCENCRTLLHPDWDVCQRCGAPIPVAAPTIASGTLVGTLATLRMKPLRTPSFVRNAPWPRTLWPRVQSARGRLAPLTAALAVALVLALLGLLTQQAALRSAHAAEAAARDEAAAIETRQRSAQQAQAALESEAGQARDQLTAIMNERDALRTRLTATERDGATLRNDLAAATANASEQERAATEARKQASMLAECLSGTTVALEFGRADRWSAADRALVAVAAACAAVRPLLS